MKDCEVCKPEPRPAHSGLGVPIEMQGTRHRRDCPLVPRMEPSDELRDQLRKIREAERAAWASVAEGWVIG